MFTHYRTQAILLKQENKGEADQIFTLFSRDFGMLEVLAKAIRKIASKLRSAAELFYFSEIEFIQGKAHKTLTDAVLIDKFKTLSQDPEKLIIAFSIAKAVCLLCPKQESDSQVWQLLFSALRGLNDYPNSQVSDIMVYHYFLWNLLGLLGWSPDLDICQSCQEKLKPNNLWFLPAQGGVVCQGCYLKLPIEEKGKTKKIAVETIKLLRLFLKEPIDVLKRLRFSSSCRENLKDISDFFFFFLEEEFSKPENLPC